MATGEMERRAKPKKAAALNMRITADTRSALEHEADSTGRPISEVAERWLDEAREGRSSLSALLGGRQVADVLSAMIRTARQVEDEIGDPREDMFARDALVSGWQAVIKTALPYVPPSTYEIALLDLRHEAKASLRAFWRLLESASVAGGPLEKTFVETSEAAPIGLLSFSLNTTVSRKPVADEAIDAFEELRIPMYNAIYAEALEQLGGSDEIERKIASFMRASDVGRAEAGKTLSVLQSYREALMSQLHARADAYRRGAYLGSLQAERAAQLTDVYKLAQEPPRGEVLATETEKTD
jgi:hypothetical protein